MHVGHGAHDGQILEAHMRAAVGTLGDAWRGADDLHVVVGVGHADGDLIVAAAGGEGGERGAERDLALSGQPGPDADHIGFLDPAVDEVAGVALGDDRNGGVGLAQIGLQTENVGVALDQLVQSPCIHNAHFQLMVIAHFFFPCCSHLLIFFRLFMA